MTNKETNANEFGLNEEDVSKVVDIKPNFNLGQVPEGKTVKIKILSDVPREIEYEDKNTGEAVKAKVLDVVDLEDELEKVMWLNSKSLKMQIFNVAQQVDGNLSGVIVKITPRIYKHEKFGDVRGYTVQRDHLATEFDVE